MIQFNIGLIMCKANPKERSTAGGAHPFRSISIATISNIVKSVVIAEQSKFQLKFTAGQYLKTRQKADPYMKTCYQETNHTIRDWKKFSATGIQCR